MKGGKQLGDGVPQPLDEGGMGYAARGWVPQPWDEGGMGYAARGWTRTWEVLLGNLVMAEKCK